MERIYSEIYSHEYGDDGKSLFRYNFAKKMLEQVCVPSKEMLDDIKDDLDSKLDWLKAEAKANLKSYEETGYVVITAGAYPRILGRR